MKVVRLHLEKHTLRYNSLKKWAECFSHFSKITSKKITSLHLNLDFKIKEKL